jgi:hypothetical protein
MAKKEKPRNNGTMTEAAFWSFIRSTLRRKSMYWKPVSACKQAARRKYVGDNKRQKWEYQCAECLGWFSDKLIDVDHINECGTLNKDTAGEFIERLFCEKEGLQVLCKECHKKKTHGE